GDVDTEAAGGRVMQEGHGGAILCGLWIVCGRDGRVRGPINSPSGGAKAAGSRDDVGCRPSLGAVACRRGCGFQTPAASPALYPVQLKQSSGLSRGSADGDRLALPLPNPLATVRANAGPAADPRHRAEDDGEEVVRLCWKDCGD